MKPWNLLEKVALERGRVMALYEHDGEYVLRVNGRELMSTRRCASEVRLGELGGRAVTPGGRALIGGLGLGFTLRAALAEMPRRAELEVAELLPDVVAWNRNPAYPLAHRELGDPRTRVVIEDVYEVIAGGSGGYDAIMLDADNGTTAMMTEGNRRLYEARGLDRVRAALRPGGTVIYWSASAEPAFHRLMERSGFQVEVETVRAYGSGGPKHTLLIGRR